MKTPKRITDNNDSYSASVHGRNPGDMDQFPEDQGAYYQPEDEDTIHQLHIEQEIAQERVNKMLSIAKDILTERQYQVFIHLGVTRLSQQKTAELMGVSQPTVNEHWEKACHKLQQYEKEIYND
jgi:RNA polymerase sigma factor (sigma-70 family)